MHKDNLHKAIFDDLNVMRLTIENLEVFDELEPELSLEERAWLLPERQQAVARLTKIFQSLEKNMQEANICGTD